MIRKTISMPDQMGEWMTSRITSGRYANESEYVRDLIRRDQDRANAEAELARMYDEAVASGRSTRSKEEIKAGVVERLRANGHVLSE